MQEVLVRSVMSLYEGAKKMVRVNSELSQEFDVTIQYNTINFIEHQNRAITARTMLQIPQV